MGCDLGTAEARLEGQSVAHRAQPRSNRPAATFPDRSSGDRRFSKPQVIGKWHKAAGRRLALMSEPAASHHEPTDAHASTHDAHPDKHAEEALGPLDWPAWRAAIVGVAVAALMVFLFALAAWR
jgi:hypothetical protein